MTYQFEILRNTEVCNNNTVIGRDNDWRFRMENELKRLQVLIKNYEKDPLIGSHEFNFYRFPEIKKNQYSKALSGSTFFDFFLLIMIGLISYVSLIYLIDRRGCHEIISLLKR